MMNRKLSFETIEQRILLAAQCTIPDSGAAQYDGFSVESGVTNLDVLENDKGGKKLKIQAVEFFHHSPINSGDDPGVMEISKNGKSLTYTSNPETSGNGYVDMFFYTAYDPSSKCTSKALVAAFVD